VASFERDPVSISFDRAAAKLLSRAYATPGSWVSTWVQYPPPRWISWAAWRGINLAGKDRWGEVRWVRGFKRSVYYLHKWYFYETTGLQMGMRRNTPNRSKAIQWQSGRMGRLGYAVRIRVVQGGSQAERAVTRKPVTRRYTEDDEYRSSAADHDW